jgi:RNA polymerase sigma-70 factor (ECF subfamily)
VDDLDGRTDAELAARAQADPTAFAPLYRRYLTPVYRYCLRRLGTREAAEDATSQTFTKALAALPAYRPGTIRGWLFTIAHHVVLDELPKKPLVVFDESLDREDGSRPLDQDVIGDEIAAELTGLLHQLGPMQRHVIELRLAGLSGLEIAHLLGRSREAVDIAQYRAIVKLRELMLVGSTEEVDGSGAVTRQRNA